jgi:hypothetical protein
MLGEVLPECVVIPDYRYELRSGFAVGAVEVLAELDEAAHVVVVLEDESRIGAPEAMLDMEPSVLSPIG